MRPAKLTFWTSACGCAWVLAGYPLALLLLPRRPWRQAGPGLPSVTLIVPAFNERDALGRKLAALRTLDYPADLLEVIVPIDEDAELARATALDFPEVTVLFQPERAGKAAAVNRASASARSELVVMTDANNVLEPGSVRAAVRHFADPEVWAVAGRRGEIGSAYDRYEDLVRSLESRSGSVAGMSGEFMAVRRDRLPRLDPAVVNDDGWLLCALVAAGGRVVYEPRAGSLEPRVPAKQELARRSRMAAGRTMLWRELRGLPLGFAWRLASHKFGRLALPFLMLPLFASSLRLRRTAPYRGAAVLQSLAYGTGCAAALGVAPRGPAGAPARAAGQLLLGNIAVAIGAVRGVRGRQSVRWEPVR